MIPLRKHFALAPILAICISATASVAHDLITASGAGDLFTVKALIAANADVDAKRGDGITALMSASQNGHLDAVQALLAAKAEVNATVLSGFTALYMASTNGHVEVVRALLAANADVNARAINGATALVAASLQVSAQPPIEPALMDC